MSMDITGGLIMYMQKGVSPGSRYRDGEPPLGRKAVFLNKGGRDLERRAASRLFQKGQRLIVTEIYVDTNRSEVEFIEYPNRRFNTAMFQDVE
jgi:hypothetical protein